MLTGADPLGKLLVTSDFHNDVGGFLWQELWQKPYFLHISNWFLEDVELTIPERIEYHRLSSMFNIFILFTDWGRCSLIFYLLLDG